MLLFGAIILMGCGCAFHAGSYDGAAELSSGNFEIVGFAEGSAEATYVLGLGGNQREAIVSEAKRDMYRRYPLKKGQAFGNITVNRKIGFYIIVSRAKYTVTADIIQFDTKDSSGFYQSYFGQEYKSGFLEKEKAEDGDFMLSSPVYGSVVLRRNYTYLLMIDNEFFETGLFQSLQDERFIFKIGDEITKELSRDQVFSISPRTENMKIDFQRGQRVKTFTLNKVGIIRGIGVEHALVEFEYKKFERIAYSNLVLQ